MIAVIVCLVGLVISVTVLIIIIGRRSKSITLHHPRSLDHESRELEHLNIQNFTTEHPPFHKESTEDPQTSTTEHSQFQKESTDNPQQNQAPEQNQNEPETDDLSDSDSDDSFEEVPSPPRKEASLSGMIDSVSVTGCEIMMEDKRMRKNSKPYTVYKVVIRSHDGTYSVFRR